VDFDLLNRHVATGVVNTQRHPTLPLTIYNYSARCQYERLWDSVTLQCRGLVCRGERIVARPFRKFFNDTEHAELPWHEPAIVTEKMDGSLGILFFFDGQWVWSTRGSFTSEQSRTAAEMFADGFSHVELNPTVTYLFEIIYPENRIVVDYGSRRDLVLLGMIDTAADREVMLRHAPEGLTVVRHLSTDRPLSELRSIIADDQEGYVVRFESGLRVKVKGSRYVELHRAISGLSSRSVWDALSSGKGTADLLDVVPDECAEWIKDEAAAMQSEHCRLMGLAEEAVKEAGAKPTRKEQAAVILSRFKDVSSAAFALLDGKEPGPIIWRSLYPERRVPRMTARLES
jgi:RNA ligase